MLHEEIHKMVQRIMENPPKKCQICHHKPKTNDFSDPLAVLVFPGEDGEDPNVLAVCDSCRESVFPGKIGVGIS